MFPSVSPKPDQRYNLAKAGAALRTAVAALDAEVLPELPDARIDEDLVELHRAIQGLEVERLRRVAEFERRRLHTREGHLSAASWMVGALQVSWGQARRDVRTARALGSMPATRAAVTSGELPIAAAHVLAEARGTAPEAFARAEGALVAVGAGRSLRDLHRAVGRWLQHALIEREGGVDEGLRAQRRLHVSTTFMGMVRVDGDLDPETGETVVTALRAVLDADARAADSRRDERTPAQRRADALGEICRQWLDRGDRPGIAGERPHLTVVVGAESLRSVGGSTGTSGGGFAGAEADHVGPIATATARRFACDSSLTRVVMSARSEPIDVGRRTPVVPAPMRRAVIVRDRHCRFPGCDRPHTWCDAHHVVHWAEGGTTAVGNLLLLCRPHHRLVHEGGFRLTRVDGRPRFLRPDGTALEGRAPPSTSVP